MSSTYLGVPWAPKQASGAVANCYATHGASAQAKFLGRRPVAG